MNILTQKEIDALLSVVEDDEEEDEEEETVLDESKIDEIGAVRFPGTQEKDLQSIEIGNEGYLSFKNRYSNLIIKKFKVVHISESGQTVVLLDSILNSRKVKISEIQDRFYKTDKIYQLYQKKSTYIKIVEILENNFQCTIQEFLEEIQKIKKEYPEIWL